MKQDIAEIAGLSRQQQVNLLHACERVGATIHRINNHWWNKRVRPHAEDLKTLLDAAHLLAHSHPEKPPSSEMLHSDLNKDRNAKEESPRQ